MPFTTPAAPMHLAPRTEWKSMPLALRALCRASGGFVPPRVSCLVDLSDSDDATVLKANPYVISLPVALATVRGSTPTSTLFLAYRPTGFQRRLARGTAQTAALPASKGIYARHICDAVKP